MSMYLIGSTGSLGASSQGQVFFNSIPQTYTHLQLRVFGRIQTSASNSATAGLQINGDGGTNYDGHYMQGNGTTITCSRQGFYNAWFTQPFITADNSLANTFGCQLIDIHDYTHTSKFKTIRAMGGFDDNSSNGSIGLYSGMWRSTSAINSLTVNVSGNFFRQYSRVDLYGISSNPIATGA